MDQSKIWEHFQNSQEMHDAFDGAIPRYQFIAQKILPGTKVLNIGVGRGGLEAILIRKGVNVSCLDPSEASIMNIRSFYDLGNNARVGEVQNIPFENDEFDYVILSEVLEHLPENILESALLEVRRVVRPEGRFIGTVPSNEKLSDGHTVCPHCGEVFHRWGHLQSFSKARILTLLSSFDYGIISVQVRSFPDWSRSGVKNLIKSSLRYLLGRLGANISNPIIFFEAQKI